MPAKVYLIGAGPGDPELITAKGIRCISEADVVIYDYLANEALLAYAREDATLIFVGKKGFTAHVTQDQINACLIEQALGGSEDPYGSDRVVARLKGGDPFVFGRGGEEALALHEAGIAFEVVPGVTSGIAAPAYAGIPVTHRGIASSVAFITGNEDPTKPETAIDWNGLAHGADTLCFYMGVKNLPQIAEKLIAAGRPGGTPVALVRWGTTPKQEVLDGTLEDIAARAEACGFKAPAIILVGEVAKIRDELAWYAKRPLAGSRIAVTRSRTQASDLVERLRRDGAEVIECPTIEIEPIADTSALDSAIDRIGTYGWVVFTSVNGVAFFFQRLRARHLDARSLAGARIAAIGSATAGALAERGIVADLVPDEYRAEAVVEEMIAEGIAPGTHVLIARAEQAREVLPESLRKAGAEVDVIAVYRTVRASGEATLRALDKIVAGEVDAITFTSSSTVRNLIGLLEAALGDDDKDGAKHAGVIANGMHRTPAEILGGIACYSIGPITSSTLADAGIPVTAEAETYTIPGLVQAIENDMQVHDA